MIFQIKKDKPTLETETIERWRRVSLAAEKEREGGQTTSPKQTNMLEGMEEHTEEPKSSFGTKKKFFQPSGEMDFENTEVMFNEEQPLQAQMERPGSAGQSSSVGVPSPSPYSGDFQPSNPKLDIEEDLRRRFGTNIKSAIGPGTVIEGKFKFDSPVRVDGSLSGEITSSSVLIVGSEANIKGNIDVGSIIILGSVTAEINATDLVEIRAGGRLEGDITTQRIKVEEGGMFSGKCNS